LLAVIFFVRMKVEWMEWVLVAGLILPAVLRMAGMKGPSLNRRVRRLTEQGRYDRALRIDRMFHWLSGYGDSLEVWILLFAGRYVEARAKLRPMAFDQEGKPRLTSTELAYYISALQYEGKCAEANELYEAAIQVPQKWWLFHEGLAKHLLGHRGDAKRACELMEYVLSHWKETLFAPSQMENRSEKLTVLAVALAGCGRYEEAEAKLQEAFKGASEFEKPELATLQFYAGMAWWYLCDLEKARVALQEAKALSPQGAIGMWSQKRLEELDKWEAHHGHGPALRACLLIEAGRCTEARDLLKPLAFDENGQPRLTSMELFHYAAALSQSGERVAAQELLEAAIQTPQEKGHFHEGLAKCLLLQNKEPDRARELIEQVMATWGEKLSPEERLSRPPYWIALHAWALARCGRREEAEARVQEALAKASALTERDQAGARLYAGRTWLALGDEEKARAAWKEVESIYPQGSVGLSARKELEKLEGRG
jgi:tetratricopeptide (TPR) repeat protein